VSSLEACRGPSSPPQAAPKLRISHFQPPGAILYGLLRAGALPPSRLARVIAFIEAAPPTASIVAGRV
jgi:hypothetical protein